MDPNNFKGFYTEYGYRGAEELSEAHRRIQDLEEEIQRLKEQLQEEREIRAAMVR